MCNSYYMYTNLSCSPPLASAHIASKHEELEPIYSTIHRSIIEGLNSYEK